MSSIFRKVQIFDSIVNLHEKKSEIMKQKKSPTRRPRIVGLSYLGSPTSSFYYQGLFISNNNTIPTQKSHPFFAQQQGVLSFPLSLEDEAVPTLGKNTLRFLFLAHL